MNKYRQISLVLWWILVANVIVAAVKITIGMLMHINSLTADGFHAITDSTSNIVGLIGIKMAAKPADDEHPYGHQKFETVASLIIGIMLFIIVIRIIYSAIMWFTNPIVPSVNIPSIIALVITLVINIFVATYEYKRGKQLDSEVLISDSIHTRSDILISLGVIIGLILIKLGVSPIIDPILSLIIAVFVFRACYEILKTTFDILLDHKVIDEKRIVEIVLSADESIKDVHKIRSRGKNNYIYIDLHIIIPWDKTVKEAHDLSHKIQALLKDQLDTNVDLIAHIEPEELML